MVIGLSSVILKSVCNSICDIDLEFWIHMPNNLLKMPRDLLLKDNTQKTEFLIPVFSLLVKKIQGSTAIFLNSKLLSYYALNCQLKNK